MKHVFVDGAQVLKDGGTLEPNKARVVGHAEDKGTEVEVYGIRDLILSGQDTEPSRSGWSAIDTYDKRT
jgi:hypothetical protein